MHITLVGKVINLFGKVIAVQEAFVSSLVYPLFLFSKFLAQDNDFPAF